MRARLDRWMEETGDRGRQPEPEAAYDSDMKVYLGRQGDAELENNIRLMKQ